LKAKKAKAAQNEIDNNDSKETPTKSGDETSAVDDVAAAAAQAKSEKLALARYCC
jgi:hypothetical protein